MCKFLLIYEGGKDERCGRFEVLTGDCIMVIAFILYTEEMVSYYY
jgi:hypothetical protein